jgi:hypothetical protein
MAQSRTRPEGGGDKRQRVRDWPAASPLRATFPATGRKGAQRGAFAPPPGARVSDGIVAASVTDFNLEQKINTAETPRHVSDDVLHYIQTSTNWSAIPHGCARLNRGCILQRQQAPPTTTLHSGAEPGGPQCVGTAGRLERLHCEGPRTQRPGRRASVCFNPLGAEAIHSI